MKTPALLSILGVAALMLGCATGRRPLTTVRYVDLPRYMGDWYVIANIPYFAEKGCVESIESYALRTDGRIANWFRFRKKSFDAPQQRLDFVARVINKRTNAEWRVHFAPLISAGYYIVDLDRNYQWTAVGHPSRRYGWIMARTKTLPENIYRSILRRLEEQGYDPELFVKVPQTRNQPRSGAE
jgi:apolipoprotein D and lipocalin family protein